MPYPCAGPRVRVFKTSISSGPGEQFGGNRLAVSHDVAHRSTRHRLTMLRGPRMHRSKESVKEGTYGGSMNQ